MSHRLRNLRSPALALLLVPATAQADVIVDWNAKAEAIGLEKRMQPPPNARGMAMMHVAMFEAVNADQRRYSPYRLNLTAERNASPEAAAAAAAHDVLVALLPGPAGKPRSHAQGVARPGSRWRMRRPKASSSGKKAAAGILALRANDGIAAPRAIVRYTAAGVYVPTVIPVSSTDRPDDAMGDDLGLAVPAGAAAGARDRRPGRRIVNEIREYRRPRQLQAHGRADRDRPLLVRRPVRRPGIRSCANSPRPRSST